MFATHDRYKSPFSKILDVEGEHHWTCTEIQVAGMWFLVSFRETLAGEGGPEISRTMLFSSFEHVTPIIENSGKGVFTFASVHIVTPGRLNGSGEWAMDPIAKVWSAKQRCKTSREVQVYETRAGQRYASASLITPTEDLILGALKFDLSKCSD